MKSGPARRELVSLWVRLALFLIGGTAFAQSSQTEQDEYTQYELLAPGTLSFKITYLVTATTPGATLF